MIIRIQPQKYNQELPTPSQIIYMRRSSAWPKYGDKIARAEIITKISNLSASRYYPLGDASVSMQRPKMRGKVVKFSP